MTNSDSSLLIVEDSGVLLAILMRWFNETFPNKSVLGVKSIAAAEEAMAAIPIDFFLVDHRLPDGTGLDFMSDVRTVKPDARFILMTLEMPTSECERLQALKPVCSFRKPVDLGELEWALRPHILDAEDNADAAPSLGFKTMMRGVTALNVVQLKCMEAATGALEFRNSADEVGRIYLAQGEIIHAETDRSMGIDALAEIIQWPDGAIQEMSLWGPPARATIGLPWQSTLMEAAKLADEGVLTMASFGS